MNIIGYNASKAAVIQMALSMACELGSQKIRVNSLSPGYIYTPSVVRNFDEDQEKTHYFCRMTVDFEDIHASWASQNPLGRIGRPHEVRGVVTWLSSDASTFCTGSEYVDVPHATSGTAPLTKRFTQHYCGWRSWCLVILFIIFYLV